MQTLRHSAANTIHLIQFCLASAIANTATADSGGKEQTRHRAALTAAPIPDRAREMGFSPSCTCQKEDWNRFYASKTRMKSNLFYEGVFSSCPFQGRGAAAHTQFPSKNALASTNQEESPAQSALARAQNKSCFPSIERIDLLVSHVYGGAVPDVRPADRRLRYYQTTR